MSNMKIPFWSASEKQQEKGNSAISNQTPRHLQDATDSSSDAKRSDWQLLAEFLPRPLPRPQRLAQ
jgi:hypothetical protein